MSKLVLQICAILAIAVSGWQSFYSMERAYGLLGVAAVYAIMSIGGRDA